MLTTIASDSKPTTRKQLRFFRTKENQFRRRHQIPDTVLALDRLIIIRILEVPRHPVKKSYHWIKKKITQLKRAKRPIPKVPQPCVLKLDIKKDIDKWVNQARMYVEPLEEYRRVEMLLMLVDQNV